MFAIKSFLSAGLLLDTASRLQERQDRQGRGSSYSCFGFALHVWFSLSDQISRSLLLILLEVIYPVPPNPQALLADASG